jgi:hypothetical protein
MFPMRQQAEWAVFTALRGFKVFFMKNWKHYIKITMLLQHTILLKFELRERRCEIKEND